MHLARFQRRADHAVKSRTLRIFRVMHDDLVNRFRDEQVLPHALLARRGELRHGDKKRARPVRARQPFKRRLHHGDSPARMKIAHVHIEPREHRHRFFHRIRNVVELQIEEDLMTSFLDFADNRRSLRVKKLHADFHIRLFLLE